MAIDRDPLIRLGKNLKLIRETQNLSQKNLAELSGVSRTTIRRVENGTTHVRIINFLRICDALDVSPSTLMDFNP